MGLSGYQGEGMTDDKNLVIMALLLIAVCLIWIEAPKENVNIINNIVAGLLGMAVGKVGAK